MRNWKRWLIFLITSALGLGIVYIAFNFVFMEFFVNLWWFDSLNYKGYYLLRLNYRYIVFFAVLLVFALIFFLNFWLASRYIGLTCNLENGASPESRKKYQQLLQMFQSGSMKIYTPLSFLMAIPIALPLYQKWEAALLFIFGGNSGATDPVFGKDISFYLLSMPVYSLMQNRFLIVFSLLFVFLVLLYFIESRMLCRTDSTLPDGARIHLGVIAIIVVLIQAWGFVLNRLSLVYTDTHQPRFPGPGFIEMWMDLPLIWVEIGFFLLAAFSLIFYINKKKGRRFLIATAVIFLVAFTFRSTFFMQETIQKYIVTPWESEREKPYIERSIQATLAAFGLDDVETREYTIERRDDFFKDPNLRQSLRNIPVWDRTLLDTVYSQLQSFRSYYRFAGVDVDRYTVGGVYQQVYLAARELSVNHLPDSAKTWTNLHLQYTHGHGVVMTPAVQGGEEPMTWFVQDIPARSNFGFKVNRPEIYYGIEDYTDYILVPNDMGEIDHERGKDDVLVHYSGKGGIPLSQLRQILFSVYFKERNIFFSKSLDWRDIFKNNSRTRILLHRNIQQAIQRITPFFLLDNDPYIVSTQDGLFWIQDAYTFSDKYPNAQMCNRDFRRDVFSDDEFADLSFNYIRNSVKIVVDAYNGSISYYISDPKDPIVQAYSRMYHGLLKSLDKMPEELRKHLRYPKQLFKVQMAVYAKYHQTDPQIFYRGEDTWDFAKLSTGQRLVPYYMTLDLLSPDNPEFMMVCPISPLERDNLRALAIVGCDGDNYGRIVLYSFPRGQQIYGPSQITALINQDSNIAQLLSLWNQAGSEVKFGRMVVIPVSNSLLYVQPIYLLAESQLKIPELKRIVVSQGDMAVEARNLEEALLKLEQGVRERDQRIKKRLAPAAITPGVTPAPVPES